MPEGNLVYEYNSLFRKTGSKAAAGNCTERGVWLTREQRQHQQEQYNHQQLQQTTIAASTSTTATATSTSTSSRLHHPCGGKKKTDGFVGSVHESGRFFLSDDIVLNINNLTILMFPCRTVLGLRIATTLAWNANS